MLFAQQESSPPNVLRQPRWYLGATASGGFSVLEVTSPVFPTANRTVSSLALGFHIGDIITRENQRGISRGTFEWDFDVIPVQLFWVLGTHYTGGFDTGPRWNFTHNRRRLVPFVGLAGGLTFSPRNFPPGQTMQTNFTAAADTGTRFFIRPRRSIDVAARVYHLSNAYLAPQNPGIPVAVQLVVGYSWY